MAEEVKQGEFTLKGKKPKAKQLGKTQSVTKVEIPSEVVEETKQTTPEVTKVLIKNEEENAVQEQSTEKSLLGSGEQSEESGQETVVGLQEVGKGDENSIEDVRVEEPQIIQEITEEEVKEEVKQVTSELEEAKASSKPLPENIEKLVNFMEETGGTVEDYVRLNADYSNVNEKTLLKEYYKQTKPHLDSEDVDLLLEDFTWDEDMDDEKDIRKKKIAFKEEVAKARNFLDGLKSKYYDEIKLRPGVTQEQKKAMDFFNRYNEEQQAIKQQHENFVNRTKTLLTDDFKGFDFNVGEKKFRYGIKNPNQVAEVQSDITNFIKTFLNDKNEIADMNGYHKALYAARNADTIAQHFYEQGKADAVKEVMAKSKNISTEVRTTAPGDIMIGGLKVKAVSGVDSSRLKIKTKKFN